MDVKNPVLECILGRRSVRRFKSDMVPESAVRTVAEAGTYEECNKQVDLIIDSIRKSGHLLKVR